jgi:hypothetical protein
LAVLSFGIVRPAMAAAPELLSATSRISHGPAGDHDVQLPLKGGSGVECRSVQNGLTVVLTFSQRLSPGAKVIVTAGKAKAAAAVVAANVVSVKLTDLVDADTITLSVSRIANLDHDSARRQTVTLRTLLGDVNGDGRVNARDSDLVRLAAKKTTKVNNANFRADLNIDGVISSADTTKSRTAVNAGRVVA